MGLQVMKGAKGVRIVKLVEVERRKAEAMLNEGSEVVSHDDRTALVMKAYTVFNATQIEGMAPMPQRQVNVQPAEAVEAVIMGLQSEAGGKLRLTFAGNQPAYYPRTDEIRTPPAADFHSLEDFHATLLHEAVHATGHSKRLGRFPADVRADSISYAREELIAELGSALALVSIGLPPSPSCLQSHAAYIASWLELLRRDKSEIFRAAAQAQQATDYLVQHALDVQLTIPRKVGGGAEPPTHEPSDQDEGLRTQGVEAHTHQHRPHSMAVR
jgi:antirestriction protein ArdC